MKIIGVLTGICLVVAGCSEPKITSQINVILDTDANNELDDQHAMAYLLFNQEIFDVVGITVNNTFGGGGIDNQYKEAERVLKLCAAEEIPLHKGAEKNFAEILSYPDNSSDGQPAVDFIIEKARTIDSLVLIAVGKLTNVALALKKAPDIEPRIRLVWLGSNYPLPGEYNQDNDTVALNFILKTKVPFEIVTVRWGERGGTAEVRVTPDQIRARMNGKGLRIDDGITGRHGGTFHTFGDYSINLFEHIELDGNPPSRALFDVAAVAIVKNQNWAKSKTIPAPVLSDNQWVERPDNERRIIIWEDFDKGSIIADFFETIEDPRPKK